MSIDIIVNADDYGMSEDFNKGILELIEMGVISSTTVMIFRQYVRPEELLKFKNISIGLHLELGTGTGVEDIENQINIFKKKFKVLPSHIDGHKHCHLREDNFPNVIKIAKKYNIPVRSIFSKNRKIIKKSKIKTPDRLISWHPRRMKKFFERVKNIKNTTEIVCHPGYFDKNCNYPYNRQRELELEILKSKEFNDIVDNYNIINYKKI